MLSLFGQSKRCDPQSGCAKNAAALLQALRKRALSLPIIDTTTMGFSFWGLSFAQTQEYWSMVPTDVRTLLWNQTLDDEDQHLLTRHLCPTLALQVIREAQKQLVSCVGMDNDDRAQDEAWLRVLKTLLTALQTSAPTSRVKQILEWYVPQQMGHGIDSLTALHAQRHSTMRPFAKPHAYLRLFQS
jgi:hypothetical protein